MDDDTTRFTDDWAAAGQREPSAQQRAERYQAITAAHRRLPRGPRDWTPPDKSPSASGRGRRLLGVAIVVALIIAGAFTSHLLTGQPAWPPIAAPADSGATVRTVTRGWDQDRILPAVPVSAHAPAGGYVLAEHQPDGTPVAFSPCRTWPLRLNPRGGPSFAYETLVTAVGQLQAATGVQFIVEGDTDESVTTDRDPHQPDRYGSDWAPILVDFQASPRDDLAVGRGGPLQVADPTGVKQYVTGAVTLDSTQDWTPEVLHSVLLHELAHVAGLSHVNNPGQIMNPIASDATTYQAGDRAGLATLGAITCPAPITPR